MAGGPLWGTASAANAGATGGRMTAAQQAQAAARAAAAAGPAVQAGRNLAAQGTPQERVPLFQNTIAPALREDDYIGVKTASPESVLPITASPFAINWDDLERLGSRSKRTGLLMLSDSKRTIDGGSTYAGYFGCDIVGIEPFDYSEGSAKGGILLVSLAASQTFGAAATNAGWLVRTSPLWAPPRDLENVSSLGIVVSSPGAGTLRVVATDTGGVNLNSVVRLTMRYSTTAYPVSIDGDDDTESTVFTDYDRSTWNGASTGNVDVTSLTAGTYYVSAWAHSLKGSTVRAIGRVAVA